jgi:hypothetical protein
MKYWTIMHHAVKERMITLRPSAMQVVQPYNDDIDTAKKHRRKLERRWRASRLNTDRQLYAAYCCISNAKSLTT